MYAEQTMKFSFVRNLTRISSSQIYKIQQQPMHLISGTIKYNLHLAIFSLRILQLLSLFKLSWKILFYIIKKDLSIYSFVKLTIRQFRYYLELEFIYIIINHLY